jgi:hypothetical protein
MELAETAPPQGGERMKRGFFIKKPKLNGGGEKAPYIIIPSSRQRQDAIL